MPRIPPSQARESFETHTNKSLASWEDKPFPYPSFAARCGSRRHCYLAHQFPNPSSPSLAQRSFPQDRFYVSNNNPFLNNVSVSRFDQFHIIPTCSISRMLRHPLHSRHESRCRALQQRAGRNLYVLRYQSRPFEPLHT